MPIPKMKATPKTNTNALTKEAIRVFSLCGFYCYRNNNGGIYDAKFGGYRRNSSTPGISDIIGYEKKTGKFLAVEIKVGADKLSPYQQRFLDGVASSGGYAYVVKTVDDLTEKLRLFNGKK